MARRVGWFAFVGALSFVVSGCGRDALPPPFQPDLGQPDPAVRDLALNDLAALPDLTTSDMLTPCSMAGSDGSCEPPSCKGLADNKCGPSGESCCVSPLVPGGTFFRSYDGIMRGNGVPNFTDKSNPATVSDFRLDKFEITVGRFRKFVEAGAATKAKPPAAGAG